MNPLPRLVAHDSDLLGMSADWKGAMNGITQDEGGAVKLEAKS